MLIILAALLLGGFALYKSIAGAVTTGGGLSSDGVKRLAQAIAVAEGFYVPGSRPARNHNPGDMTEDLIGKKVGVDGPFVVYATDDDGWNNLYKQIGEWLDDSSRNASPDSTISDLSDFYTTTDKTAWATNVANALGVSLDTPIKEV